jgi:hypothetical protein
MSTEGDHMTRVNTDLNIRNWLLDNEVLVSLEISFRQAQAHTDSLSET